MGYDGRKTTGRSGPPSGYRQKRAENGRRIDSGGCRIGGGRPRFVAGRGDGDGRQATEVDDDD